MDDLIAKGVQGIAISSVDPAIETSYLNDVAVKTNLIRADADAPQSRRLCYVGTDNHADGMMACRLIYPGEKATKRRATIALRPGASSGGVGCNPDTERQRMTRN